MGRTDSIIEQEYRELRQEGRKQALREVMEMVEEMKYTGYGAPTPYTVCPYPVLKARLEAMIDAKETT